MTIEPDGTPRATPSRHAPDDEISLWEVLAVLVRRRVAIVTTTIVVAALAVAAADLSTRLPRT